MLKVYLKIIIILFFTQLFFFGCSQTAQIKSDFDIEIQLNDGKSSLTVARVSDNRLKIFDINIDKNKDEKYLYSPVIKDDKQVEVSPTDNRYYKILGELLYITENVRSTDFIIEICANSPKQKPISCTLFLDGNSNSDCFSEKDENSEGISRFYSGNISFNIMYYKNISVKMKNHAVLIVDNDFNFEYWKDNGIGIELVEQKAINPDVYDPKDELEAETIEYLIYNNNYFPASPFIHPSGYIQLEMGSKKAVVSGETIELQASPEYVGDSIAIPFYSVGEYLYPNSLHEDGSFMYRYSGQYFDRSELKGTKKEFSIRFEGNKDVAYAIDNKEIKLPFKPYKKNNVLMVPLDAFCEGIGAKYHVRKRYNSILIALFDEL